MPTPLRDNNISAYVHRVMDRLVGKPDFGSSWDGGKQLRVDSLPKELRGVVKAAGNGGETVSGAQLENALWRAHDVIIKQDKSWGFHASKYSFWRSLGMGGDGILQRKEQDRASRKDAVASQLLAFISHDRYEAEEQRNFDRAITLLEAGHADWSIAYGWQVYEDDDWWTVPDDSSLSSALSRASNNLGHNHVPAGY